MAEGPIKRPPRPSVVPGAAGPVYPGGTPSRRAVSPEAVAAASEDGDTTYVIRTPSETYSEFTFGVRFRDGVGQTNSARIARKLRDDFGYAVEPDPGPSEALPPLPHEKRGRTGDREVFGPRDPRLAPGADSVPPLVAAGSGPTPTQKDGKDQGDGES